MLAVFFIGVVMLVLRPAWWAKPLFYTESKGPSRFGYPLSIRKTDPRIKNPNRYPDWPLPGKPESDL